MCSSSSAPVIAQRAAGMPQRATAARRADGSDEPSGGAQPVRPRSAKPPRRARSEAEASMELGAAMLATEAELSDSARAMVLKWRAHAHLSTRADEAARMIQVHCKLRQRRLEVERRLRLFEQRRFVLKPKPAAAAATSPGSAPAGDSLGGAAEASHDEPAEAAAPVLSSWALSMVERWRLTARVHAEERKAARTIQVHYQWRRKQLEAQRRWAEHARPKRKVAFVLKRNQPAPSRTG